MSVHRCFVGFGFGPIQSGLFLYEAFRTGRFDRLVVAEVDDRLVKALRDSSGSYSLNIACAAGVEKVTVEGIEVCNPRVERDRAKLLDAIGDADELATALPSVDIYGRGGDASVVCMLASALARAPRKSRVLYAAENHNHAAEILASQLSERLDRQHLAQLQILNTVIGKMSGVITDPEQIRSLKIDPLTPASDRAVLVEAFNRILISRISLPGFERGIDAFVEKDDLLPFEEAKLYGHNAIHALIGYLANERKLTVMSQVAGQADILSIARQAFIAESGAALTQKYACLGDPFFSATGFREYAEDLLQRMLNPFLQDLVARVIRDPARKLSWDDRLYGTMRLALEHDVRPVCMARGAAAALQFHMGRALTSRTELDQAILSLWGSSAAQPMASALAELTWQAMQK